MTRIQFELNSAQLEDLESMMRAGGVRTKKELFNNALTMLRWAIRQKENGRVVGSLKGNSFIELSTPLLDQIKEH
jgi:hypothetical protein